MNPEEIIRRLAKKVENLNLFSASKELNNINLFINCIDFTKLQQMYISYLYFYTELHQDISLKKIDKYVLNNEQYEDSYMLWKRENSEKENNKKDNKQRDIHLVFDNYDSEVKKHGR